MYIYHYMYNSCYNNIYKLHCKHCGLHQCYYISHCNCEHHNENKSFCQHYNNNYHQKSWAANDGPDDYDSYDYDYNTSDYKTVSLYGPSLAPHIRLAVVVAVEVV